MNAKFWTKESVVADAQKFSSVGEWRKQSPSAYAICCRNKWNDEACVHMFKKKQINGYWSDERVLKESNKFSSTAEWAAVSPSSYAVAKRKKLVPSSLARGLVHNQWSQSKIADVAKNCKTRGEFKSTYPSAYSIAAHKGWLEDVCAHMLVKAPWFGPRVIREFLLSHNIEFIAEYKFKNEVTVKKFPYDFYLPEFKLLIEYQGRQHKVGWFNDSADALAIQARDKVKRAFAQNSGHYYLELDQTTKKSLIKKLDSYLKHIAKGLKIVIPSQSRQLSDSELKYVETASKWSNASLIEAIDNCKSVKEFREKHPSGYDYALKNDLWERLSTRLTRITQHRKYTKNYVSGVAMACKTRSEFKITNKGAWAAAQRNGWLDEVCAHMPKHVQRSKNYK